MGPPASPAQCWLWRLRPELWAWTGEDGSRTIPCSPAGRCILWWFLGGHLGADKVVQPQTPSMAEERVEALGRLLGSWVLLALQRHRVLQEQHENSCCLLGGKIAFLLTCQNFHLGRNGNLRLSWVNTTAPSSKHSSGKEKVTFFLHCPYFPVLNFLLSRLSIWFFFFIYFAWKEEGRDSETRQEAEFTASSTDVSHEHL